MPPILIVTDHITRKQLTDLAQGMFGDLVKAVVDIEKNIMAVGGELHADEEHILIEQGSNQVSLWGINLYPAKLGNDFLEFDSMINVRPSHGNRSRSIESSETQATIRKIVAQLVVE